MLHADRRDVKSGLLKIVDIVLHPGVCASKRRPAEREWSQEEPELEPPLDAEPQEPGPDDVSPPTPDPQGDTGGDVFEFEQDVLPVEEEVEELPQEDPLERSWPTVEEYKEKWDRLLNQHSRSNPGGFSRDNLVPVPIPQLWQVRRF